MVKLEIQEPFVLIKLLMIEYMIGPLTELVSHRLLFNKNAFRDTNVAVFLELKPSHPDMHLIQRSSF